MCCSSSARSGAIARASTALILARQVTVDGRIESKAGTRVSGDARVELVAPDHPYVGRGGIKLAHALDVFAIDPAGRRALDIGASTGGFTDVPAPSRRRERRRRGRGPRAARLAPSQRPSGARARAGQRSSARYDPGAAPGRSRDHRRVVHFAAAHLRCASTAARPRR